MRSVHLRVYEGGRRDLRGTASVPHEWRQHRRGPGLVPRNPVCPAQKVLRQTLLERLHQIQMHSAYIISIVAIDNREMAYQCTN